MAETLPNSRLIRFYRGAAGDSSGRSIDEVWTYDHNRLEIVHDYVQWLFPIPEPSRFNPDAAVLTPEDAATFRNDKDLRARLMRSFDMMLEFYGLVREDGTIERGIVFDDRSANWLTPLDHNHLRMTRILQCLHQCGLPEQARALLACLEDIALHEGKEIFLPQTLRYWRGAVEAALL